MAKITRSEFLRDGATLAAAMGLSYSPALAGEDARAAHVAGSPAGTAATAAPDVIVVNARVYTVDTALPRAEAFAVKNGRFVAVGGNADVRNLANPNTQVIDAAGMTVVPGFNDAHTHPSGAGFAATTQVNLGVSSLAEVKAALRRKVASTPAGEWVIGFMFDDTKVAENRMLNIADLDEAAPDNPVFVSYRGGHIYWANSKAFALAGITASTPDPVGGRWEKVNGRLTGLIEELAVAPFNKLLPQTTTREQRQQGVKLISGMMAQLGITSVQDAGAGLQTAVAYRDAMRAGEMKFRVYAMASQGYLPALEAAGISTGFGDEWFRIGGAKFLADGGAATRTMAMSTPYVGRPDDYGILRMNQQELNEAVEDAHRHDFQVGIHANGDVAIEMVLNAYERVQKLWPRADARHRLEHCSLVTPQILGRIRDGGFIPTPFYTYIYYHGEKWVAYGEEKMRFMFAHRSFIDYGIPVASASDYPPGACEPMMALQSMVTRKDSHGRLWGPNQKITMEEALRVCTVNAAHASFEESIKGSITAGKLADFVILDKDPHVVDSDQIVNIKVTRTVVGGRTVYTA